MRESLREGWDDEHERHKLRDLEAVSHWWIGGRFSIHENTAGNEDKDEDEDRDEYEEKAMGVLLSSL